MLTPATEEFKKKAIAVVTSVRAAAKVAKVKRWEGMIGRVKALENRKIEEIKKKLKGN